MDIFNKQPNDVLDYDVDMTPWFSGIPGDEIDSVFVSVRSLTEELPSLVLGPVPHPVHTLMGASPTRFKVWLGGGTDLVDYIVSCLVTTEQDRVKELDFKIKVRNK